MSNKFCSPDLKYSQYSSEKGLKNLLNNTFAIIINNTINIGNLIINNIYLSICTYIYIYIYIQYIYIYIYIYICIHIYIYTAEKTQTTQRYFKGKLLLPLGNNISNFVQCIKLSILYGQEPICCKYTFCILFFVLDTFVNCLFFRGQCSQQFQKYAILSLFRIGLFEAAHG